MIHLWRSRVRRRPLRWASALLGAVAILLVAPRPALAYIGPGAGFVFVTSFLTLLATGLLTLFSMLLWPFRAIWRTIRRGRRATPRIRRLVVVGLDGQDPNLTDRFLAEGKLPNFARLAEQGCYHRLRTTFPSVSPVAWSSFSTGTRPARHNIFDFLDRDRRTYLPVLSSTKISKVGRVLKLGKYRLPLGKPRIRLLRKSLPFWSILGQHGVWSTILRVPITFPPDRFRGAQLSAMSVPDLLGTQGTFTLYSTRPSGDGFQEGGRRVHLEGGAPFRTVIQGPGNDLRAGTPLLEISMTIATLHDPDRVEVDVGGESVGLTLGKLSDWVSLEFSAAPGIKVRGICRMMVTEMDDHFSLYVSPINLDPERPAMPISHPSYYSVYLAKRIGKYATLGLAEDTWALNEGVIDDGSFLRQALDIDTERQEMFFAALDRLRRGALVCVFDATDRIQHMFWRYLEKDHPALRNGGTAGSPHENAIEELYVRNDALIGRVMDRLGTDDVLMVLSDHGFNSFQRGVNLNAWLHANGYLTLLDHVDHEADWLRSVDWDRTRAYALGLTGLFLNLRGREGRGIVAPGGEAAALKQELRGGLTGLVDEDRDQVGIREAFDTAELYQGPYLENAPDLLIGYNAGYRASWDGARGIVDRPVFTDNTKPWSGDHCIDPRLVPGVLFCNREIEGKDPALIDVAPTALWLFGIDAPAHMEGQVLFPSGA